MITRHEIGRFCRAIQTLGLSIVGVSLLLQAPAALAASPPSTSRAELFNAAAHEFGVPANVLLALSYNQSRWTQHTGASVDNGWGLMDLRAKAVASPEDGRGNLTNPTPKQALNTATHYTLDEAAALLHVPANKLKTDEGQNIRGAAAVLASYARQLNDGQLPSSPDKWYGALAEFSGATTAQTAASFTDDVFLTMERGAALTTSDGQSVALAPTANLRPDRGALSKLALPGMVDLKQQTASNVDCPATLNCRFIAAAYAGTDPNDKTQYGNYDTANRPQDIKINRIVIHDTDGSYDGTINWFQTSLFSNPPVYVSANYVIRSSDGAITEMVHPGDIAWQAQDWYVNMHSIGIEHEGFAVDGATWYTEEMYRSSAKLVQYLAKRYNIPLDRQHIIGHDNVPGLSPASVPGMHWDPGPYWDWGHYMDLLHGRADMGNANAANIHPGKVITISPNFATNQQPITDCSSGPCVTLPAQGTNLVYLHTTPSNSAPLLTNIYLHPDGSPGTTDIEDWSATANSGNKFVIAATQGDWIGVWYNGHIGWFLNGGGAGRTVHLSSSQVVTPRPGLASVPVYGGAYPEVAAYPPTIPPQTLSPLYSIPTGQLYTTSGKVPTDYYYALTVNASLPDDHTVVRGNDVYYQITFNHRVAYVRAADVRLKDL